VGKYPVAAIDESGGLLKDDTSLFRQAICMVMYGIGMMRDLYMSVDSLTSASYANGACWVCSAPWVESVEFPNVWHVVSYSPKSSCFNPLNSRE
jgi:hypothetical protein